MKITPFLFCACATLSILSPLAFAQSKESSRQSKWIFGVNKPPKSLPDDVSTSTLSNTPPLLWRIALGQWPADFSARVIDPEGDGENLNFEAIDSLVEQARKTGATIAPVFDYEDLALLGNDAASSQWPTPRSKFFSSLATRYAQTVDPSEQKSSPANHASPDRTIEQWRFIIDIFATPEGLRSADAAQFASDAVRLSGSSDGGIIAEIGEFSAETDDKTRAAITRFASGALQSVLAGVSIGYSLDAPNFARATEAIERLRASAFMLPLSIHEIKTTQKFKTEAESFVSPKDWGVDRTEAAYASALAAFCEASLIGGTVVLNDAPSSQTLATNAAGLSPSSIAFGRLASLLQPYFKARVDHEEGVWLMTFNRINGISSYVVFWDWAPHYKFSSTTSISRDYVLPVRQQAYHVTPLVEEFLWSKPKVLQAGKEGLPLKLGRSPLFVEIDDPGRKVMVPLGLSEGQYQLFTGKKTSTTRAVDSDAELN